MARRRERLESGVPGLDTVLCGGLWQGSVSIIQGTPGAGKTILANQICFSHVVRGGRCVYLTLLAESHDQLLMNLQPMAFYDEEQVAESIFYISAFATIQAGGLKGLLELMTREREQRGASLVVLDGVFALEAASESELDFRRVIHELGTLATITRTTILLLTNSRRGPGSPEYTMVDGWLELGHEQVEYRSLRYLQVHKSRGSDALAGRHQAVVTGAGFQVFPRLESTRFDGGRFDAGAGQPPPARPPLRRPVRTRISTGIAELDAMLQGGVDTSAMGVLAGPTGVGKTSFGLHFIGQSSAREPGLVFGFYEQPQDLIEKALSLGIGLERLIDEGSVDVLWFPPVEARIDELAYKLLEAVRRRQVARLVVDGMEAFRQSALYPDRLGRFFSALSNELARLGVTTMFTLELPRDEDLPSRLSPVSAIAEYVITLGCTRTGVDMRRTLMIEKSRRSAFDPRIRQFTIGADGVTIGGAVDD